MPADRQVDFVYVYPIESNQATMRRLCSLAAIAAILPGSLGFALTSTCVDDDAAVPEFAAALGVDVSTCAEVLSEDSR